MIDCGSDWLRTVSQMRPRAIVLTHAHPDHAWGLKNGAPCAVYATAETWRGIEKSPLRERVLIEPREPFRIGGITLEAFPVEHSIRAPAVGYRIMAGRSAVFYAPDLVYIYEAHEALHGIRVYIGDGASLIRPIIRRKGDSLVGHAAVRTQLSWCRDEGVKKALITHCGSQIVRAKPQHASGAVRDLGQDQGVDAAIAYDGLEVALP
jgi:phosphoribosyl 1,2-cyclic phosphodiesterase